MSLMDREYLTQPEIVIKSLLGKCAGCVVAHEVALNVLTEWEEGDIGAGDVSREYDMRIGSRCALGMIELSDTKVCLLNPEHVAEKMSTLNALD